MKTDRGVGIYVHIPFCKRKCDYCDFVSFAGKEDLFSAYFSALGSEISQKKDKFGALTVDSVFFGGGTPSLPESFYLTGILYVLREKFNFSENPEITTEVNPDSGSFEKLKAYKEAGFNRISIGLQSANDEELKTLSRVHDFKKFTVCYENALRAGFTDINVDLMSAIPGQTLKSYEKTLKTVAELNPSHISAYSLILEEGTPFFERFKDGKGLPDEDTDREMYSLTRAFLKDYGFERYEISNYAKPGFECKHNIGYWERKPYLGLGLAAASLMNETRYQKHGDLRRYIDGDFSEDTENLDRTSQMEEFMFLGLRLIKGVSVERFKELFGKSIEEEYGDVLKKLNKEGLLLFDDRVYLTEKGLDVANYCMSEFIK